MRFRVELTGLPTGPVYLLVQAQVGTPWAQVATQIRSETALATTTQFCLAGAGDPLDPSAPVGVHPLLDGVALTVRTSPTPEAPHPLSAPISLGAGPPPVTTTVRAPTRASRICLQVTAGPQTGSSFPLPPGDHVLGRSPYTDLQVVDPNLSRRHALLRISPDEVRLHDLGSANGTWVAGTPVGPGGVQLRPGIDIEAGGSTFTLAVTPEARALTTRPTGPDGLVPIAVPPRTTPPPPHGRYDPAAATVGLPSRRAAGTTIQYPTGPTAGRGYGATLVTALVPLVMAGMLALALRNWLYLVIGVVGPLTAAIQLLVGRRAGDTPRRSKRRYAEELAAADRALRQALEQERAERHRTNPPLPAVLACATGHGPQLWQGSGDGASWSARLGCGDVTARVEVTQGQESHHPRLPGCPLTVSLDGQALAIQGPVHDVAGLTRAVLIQLATRLAPDRCRMRIARAAADVLRRPWLEWLPHVPPEDATPDADRDLVVLLANPDDPWPARPANARALLVLAPDPTADPPTAPWQHVPPWCDMSLRVDQRGTRSLTLSAAQPAQHVVEQVAPDLAAGGRSELLALPDAAEAARSLAPLRPHLGTSPTSGPHQGFLARLGLPESVPELTRQLRTSWAHQPLRPAAVRFGELLDGSGEPCELDLDRDGPHLLLAGMTGSGKSELLQTLVAALVINHPPEELALVLLDYKGGSAFAPFAGLPHTVGVLTDLDPDVTARALRALGAELRHREALLAAHGAADARAYAELRRHHQHLEPLPRLVVVVDEFRILAEDHAPLMSALVRIAGLGRSLGLHLVLATQRPGGIVSAEIRANVNARIALRVRDAGESHDVIDSPVAAHVDPHTPGRGFLRVGARTPVAFYAWRAAEPVARDRPYPVHVTRRSSPGPPPDALSPAEGNVGSGGGGGGSDGGGRTGSSDDGGDSPEVCDAPAAVDVIVAAAIQAAGHDGHRAPPPVWAPPLPLAIPFVASPLTGDDPVTTLRCGGDQEPPAAFAYGYADDPDGRSIEPLVWLPQEQGHLALIGTGRSGRTGAARAVLAALAARCPQHTHVYVIDALGGLASCGDVPSCAALLGTDDVGALRRLIDVLLRPVSPGVLRVLVIHGWEQVLTALDGIDHGRSTARLLELLRATGHDGVRLLLTGDRGLLTGTVSGAVEHKVVLRLADPRDGLLAGIRAPAQGTAGRGVHQPSGRTVQLTTATEQDLAAVSVAGERRHARCQRPPRLRPLPRRLEAHELPAPAGHHESADHATVEQANRLPIGIGLDGSPAWLEPAGTVLITGPAGSGRTTTLRLIGHQAALRGLPVVVITSGGGWSAGRGTPPAEAMTGNATGSTDNLTDNLTRSSHNTGGSVRVIPPSRCHALAAELVGGAVDTHDAHPARQPTLVLVDDLDELPDETGEHLQEVLAAGACLIVTMRTASALPSFTGLVGRLRRGVAVILSPVPADGQLMGVAIDSGEPPLPGRACLVRRGAAHPIHVALPPPWVTGGVSPVAHQPSWAGQ